MNDISYFNSCHNIYLMDALRLASVDFILLLPSLRQKCLRLERGFDIFSSSLSHSVCVRQCIFLRCLCELRVCVSRFYGKTFCCQQRANINKTIPYPNGCITCTALDSSIFFLTLSFRFSIFFPTRCRNLCAFVSWFLLKHKRCLISSTLFRRTFTWCLWIELCLLTNISTPVTVLFHSFPALHMTSTIYECSVDFIFQCSGWRNRHF